MVQPNVFLQVISVDPFATGTKVAAVVVEETVPTAVFDELQVLLAAAVADPVKLKFVPTTVQNLLPETVRVGKAFIVELGSETFTVVEPEDTNVIFSELEVVPVDG